MKHKIIWALMPLLLTTIVNAQEINTKPIKPYWGFIGGTVVLETSKNYNDDSQYFQKDDYTLFYSLEPKVGIMVSQNFFAGLKIGLTYMDNIPYTIYVQSPMTPDGNSYTYEYIILLEGEYFVNVSPFMRFQNNLIGRLKYYVEPGFGVEFIFDDQKYYGYLNCGFQFSISQKMGFELQVLSLKYSELHGKGIESKISDFTTDFIFSNPNIGLVFYLK